VLLEVGDDPKWANSAPYRLRWARRFGGPRRKGKEEHADCFGRLGQRLAGSTQKNFQGNKLGYKEHFSRDQIGL
jgi:hypothetical protein